MTAKQLAEQIEGAEYGSELTKEQRIAAKEHGLVVVYGYSDDNVELEGAIRDEVGAYGGTLFHIGNHGVIPTFEALKDNDADEESFRRYFHAEGSKVEIVAHTERDGLFWDIAAYLIKPDLRQLIGERFTIMEEGEKFCRGTVLNLKVALA